jgi:hypothetical protein
VKTTPCLGPYKLSGLFTLKRKGVRLGRSEEYRLSITTDEKTSVSGVNSVFGKCTKLGCSKLENIYGESKNARVCVFV